MTIPTAADARYLQILLDPIRTCATYQPKLGQGGPGLSLADFQTLYRADPFYAWFGLDHELMYAAHKAAGGMTSIYRQVGLGSERLFRRILQDQLGLTETQTRWSYSAPATGGRSRLLALDGRIEVSEVADPDRRVRVEQWLVAAAKEVGVGAAVQSVLRGAVFEIRQGYKSKDSKRQNADIANATEAYKQAYLPCLAVFSAQIDGDIKIRYRSESWVILTGSIGEPSVLRSTYAFMRDVIGFDLAQFFMRNRDTLRSEVDKVLRALLSPRQAAP